MGGIVSFDIGRPSLNKKNKGVYGDVGSFFCVLLHFDK